MNNYGGIAYYIAFALGYDLLQIELTDSNNRECDKAYEKCLNIAIDFLASEYNDITKGLYECLQNYIKDKQYQDLNN